MDYDSICERCGRCCQASMLKVDGQIVQIKEQYCEFYNEETHDCICYAQRHEMKPECLSVPQAIDKGMLPEDCPYVKDLKFYKCKVKGR